MYFKLRPQLTDLVLLNRSLRLVKQLALGLFVESIRGRRSIRRLFCRVLLDLVSSFDSASKLLFEGWRSFCQVKRQGLEMLQVVFLGLGSNSKALVMTIRLNSGDSFFGWNLVIIIFIILYLAVVRVYEIVDLLVS